MNVVRAMIPKTSPGGRISRLRVRRIQLAVGVPGVNPLSSTNPGPVLSTMTNFDPVNDAEGDRFDGDGFDGAG
jgi:hypothetical protein